MRRNRHSVLLAVLAMVLVGGAATSEESEPTITFPDPEPFLGIDQIMRVMDERHEQRLDRIDRFVEKVATGQVDGLRFGDPRIDGHLGPCAPGNCVVYEVGRDEDGSGATRRTLSGLEVQHLAGLNPGADFTEDLALGFMAVGEEIYRAIGGSGVLVLQMGFGERSSEWREQTWLPRLFTMFGGALAKTARKMRDAEQSLETGAARARERSERDAALTSNLVPVRREVLAGQQTVLYSYTSPGVDPSPSDSTDVSSPGLRLEGATLHAAHLWIDEERWVLVGHRFEGVLDAEHGGNPFFVETIRSDFRNPPGCGAMLEPYRRVRRMGGFLSETDAERMRQARRQLQQFERQRASMPAGQRKMMEKMIGPAMQSARLFNDDGSIEMVEEVEQIWCNPDLRSLFGAGTATTGTEGKVTPELLRQIQQHLATLGYQPGNTDGVLDTRTRVAISQYQAEHGLPVTGEPSSGLATSLAAEVSRRT